MFVKRSKEESSFFVYCQNCALKSSPTLAEYGVLYQYEVSDLMQTYDSFVMFQVCSHVGVVSLVCSIVSKCCTQSAVDELGVGVVRYCSGTPL